MLICCCIKVLHCFGLILWLCLGGGFDCVFALFLIDDCNGMLNLVLVVIRTD